MIVIVISHSGFLFSNNKVYNNPDLKSPSLLKDANIGEL